MLVAIDPDAILALEFHRVYKVQPVPSVCSIDANA